ncbi:hypothetical protein [Salicibibacter kimchii]|uniref:hypothetical protein n=1 Tax=Salicibibacter kimchii TaxID=2099786 RepID=UPI0013595600|nr:hypothetical protein [Salicibibacter kimchii]
MGEPSLELLEQNVQHMSEDMRDIKKRVDKLETDQYDLKANMQITQHSLTALTESINDVKVDLKEMRKEMNSDKEQQLESMKSFLWKFGSGLAVLIVGGMVTAVLM